MNFVTPSEAVNGKIVAGLSAVFGRFEPLLPDFHMLWGWNHEDRAANPLHILLVLASIIVLISLRRRVKDDLVWGAVITVLGVWGLLSTVIRIDPFGIRYQLPFLVAWAPLFGVALTLLDRPRLTQTVLVFALILMLPWLVYNRTRSLIALQDSPGPFTIPCSWHLGCGVRSVLVEPPSTFLFINIFDDKDPYLEMAQTIKSNQCDKVGLSIDSWDSEYVFWWILDAPQSGRRIETINTYPELEKYLDPTFHPCAIICKTCGRNPVFHNLPMKSDYHGATLYMGDTYTFQP